MALFVDEICAHLLRSSTTFGANREVDNAALAFQIPALTQKKNEISLGLILLLYCNLCSDVRTINGYFSVITGHPECPCRIVNTAKVRRSTPHVAVKCTKSARILLTDRVGPLAPSLLLKRTAGCGRSSADERSVVWRAQEAVALLLFFLDSIVCSDMKGPL